MFDGLLFFYIHLNKDLITFLHTLLTATSLITAQCRARSSADVLCNNSVSFPISVERVYFFSHVVLWVRKHDYWRVIPTIAVFEVVEIKVPYCISGAGLPLGRGGHVLLPVQSVVVTQTLVSLCSNSWADQWFQWAGTVSAMSRWTDVVSHFAAVIDLLLCAANLHQNGLAIRLSPKSLWEGHRIDEGYSLPMDFLYLILLLSCGSREPKIISDSSSGHIMVSILI